MGELSIHRMPGHLVRRLHQLAVAVFQQETDGIDLTPVQFAALSAVEQRPGVDQATLSALIGYDRATIGGVVDRLEAKGWLVRSLDASDRRVRRLEATEPGLRTLERARPGVARAQRAMLHGLDAGERAEFERLCRKVLAARAERQGSQRAQGPG